MDPDNLPSPEPVPEPRVPEPVRERSIDRSTACLNPEDEEHIIKEWNKGKSIHHLARALNTSKDSIQLILEKHGSKLVPWKERFAKRLVKSLEQTMDQVDGQEDLKPTEASVRVGIWLDKLQALAGEPTQVIEVRHTSKSHGRIIDALEILPGAETPTGNDPGPAHVLPPATAPDGNISGMLPPYKKNIIDTVSTDPSSVTGSESGTSKQ